MSAAKNALSKVSGKYVHIQVYPPHFTHTQCMSPHLYRYRLHTMHCVCVHVSSVSESFETRRAHVESIIVNAIGIHYSGLAREVQVLIQHTYT